jgi:hypothetical protein
MKRRNILSLLVAINFLIILSLSCKQAGEIITPAEATQRFEATQAADTGEEVLEAEGAEFAVGSMVELASEGHLVGLYKDPSDKNPYTFATRGDEVNVVGSQEIEGDIWYKIESTAGNGWLPSANVEAIE